MKYLLLLSALFFPLAVHAEAATVAQNLDLTHHAIGYLSVFITVMAYIAAMSEEVTELRKSKPMVLGSALVCYLYLLRLTRSSQSCRAGFRKQFVGVY